MTLEHSRAAYRSAATVVAVDQLVTRLYLAARSLSDDGLKDLLTQAALSLAEPVSPSALVGRLDVVRALVRLAVDDADQRHHLELAVIEVIAALRHGGPDSSAVHATARP